MTPLAWIASTTLDEGRCVVGLATFADDLLTVTTPAGVSKTAEIRGMPAQVLARMLLPEAYAAKGSA